MKLVYDSQSDIPEGHRDRYEEQDGRWVLTQAGADKFEAEAAASGDGGDNYDELKGAITKERGDHKTTRTKLRDLESTIEAAGGLERINELLENERTAEAASLEKKGEWEKLRQQQNDAHALELKKKDDEIAGLTRRLDKELRGRQVMEAIATHGGNPNLLTPILMGVTKLSGEGESLGVEVVEDGVPQVDAQGNPLTVAGYVERIKSNENYAGAFAGTSQSGGGGQPSGDGDNKGGRQPDGNGDGNGDGDRGGMLPDTVVNGFSLATAGVKEKVAFLERARAYFEEQGNPNPHGAAESAMLNL